MKLTATQNEALTIMAQHPPERPFVLYRMKSGPYLPRFGDGNPPWLSVPQAQVDRLVGWGLLVPTLANGEPERVAYWSITANGRRLIRTILPVPASSSRRRAERSS